MRAKSNTDMKTKQNIYIYNVMCHLSPATKVKSDSHRPSLANSPPPPCTVVWVTETDPKTNYLSLCQKTIQTFLKVVASSCFLVSRRGQNTIYGRRNLQTDLACFIWVGFSPFCVSVARGFWIGVQFPSTSHYLLTHTTVTLHWTTLLGCGFAI